MKKWLKRILLLLVLLLVGLIVVSAASYYMLQQEPEWAHRPAMSAETRQQAAARAAHQISRISDMAASLRAFEARRQKAEQDGTTLPADELPAPITVQLTEDEINAFYASHASTQGWADAIEQYVQNPQVVLQEKRLILYGKIKERDLNASVFFAPTIEEDGHLRMDFIGMRGGTLPLPEAVYGSYRDKLINTLSKRLPMWQRAAQMDARGLPNDAAVQAAMSKLFLQSIHHQPAEPVVFLPIMGRNEQVPVRVTRLIVSQGQIELTLSPMSQADRTKALQQIKQPLPPTPEQVSAKSQ